MPEPQSQQLSEERRRQLDDIVERMEAAGEPDQEIRAVVDDFKSKYLAETKGPSDVGDRPGSATVPVAVAAAGALPGVLRLGHRVAEQLATSPNLGKAAAGKALDRLNVVKQVYDVATGKQSALDAGKDAAVNYVGGRAVQAPRALQAALRIVMPTLQRGAQAVASLPAVSGSAATGAAFGAGLPALLLAALQRDANRRPEIDPNANTPASTILRGFETMAGRR
jgi:hypothetical protein